ncbi:SanA/YdcF family protein [Neisseria sp. Ec49-e6-T10]|uniref:SanA/YdcF family protein n=1 Tax=Neisseria sp. Ec49-e6-T10 TaxID=3140744 RepID=UPI003EBD2E3B
MHIRSTKKRIKQALLLLIIGFISFTIWANYSIVHSSKSFVQNNMGALPQTHTALILGTSKRLKSGHDNPFFTFRIQAAAKLYHEGKVKYFIVSGDNSHIKYNEPRDMQKALIAQGIPSEHIFLDHAGFRTLDSVVRAKEIFGQNSFIIVSQKFHNERAVFLARQMDIQAYAYNARDVSKSRSIKTLIREIFARDKAYWDLIWSVQPKFLGDKVILPD